MRHAYLLGLVLASIGVVSCMDGLVLPADPNHNGTIGVNTTGGGGTGSGATTRTVTVGDNFFAPQSLTVFVADTVTWVWTGVNPHSVTFADGVGSGAKTTGTFQRFFGTPGTFEYRSTALTDSSLVGEITVLSR